MGRIIKKWFSMTLAVILVCSAVSCVAETDLASIIRNGEKIRWASKDYIVLNREMIRLSDGEILFDEVNDITSTDSYTCIVTDDSTWIMDQDGQCEQLEKKIGMPNSGWMSLGFCGKYGLFFGWCDDRSYIYDPVAKTYTELSGSVIEEIYQDSEGQVFILTDQCGIYKADGEQILEDGKYSIAGNCFWDPITNGKLTVYDQTHSAAILSPYTGEMESIFPGYSWVIYYDSDHDIYRDNTALIGKGEFVAGGGSIIVGLDGSVLKEAPDECIFTTRTEGGSLYHIESQSNDGYYNIISDKTYWYDGFYSNGDIQSITCEETGEIYKGVKFEDGIPTEFQSLKTGKTYSEDEIFESGEPIPERHEKYKPVEERMYWPIYTDEDHMAISCPDGTILGNQSWYYFDWDSVDLSESGGHHIFEDVSLCACVDENLRVAVINNQGEIVLPAEYEQVDLIESFSEDSDNNGYCLAAKKNDQWYIFDEKGQLLYSTEQAQSTDEMETGSDLETKAETDIPILSKQFAGKEAGLRKLGGQEKVTLFAGPGNDYPVIRKINPNESNSTTAYFVEDDLVFVHYVHRFVDTYGYMKKGAFAADTLTGVPEISELKYVSKKIKDETLPLTGPGERFEKWTGQAIPGGSDVRCYFTEDEYSFVEYDSGTGPARVWVNSQSFSQENVLKLDGLTLHLTEKAEYVFGTKAKDQTYVAVYPFYHDGDTLTVYECAWMGGPYSINTDSIREQLPEFESKLKAEIEKSGYTAGSFEVLDIREGKLCDADCMILDAVYDLLINNLTIKTYLRQYYVGSKGVYFSVMTSSEELMENTSSVLSDSIAWQ